MKCDVLKLEKRDDVCACVVYMCEEGRYSSKSKEVIAGCEEVCVPPVSSRRRWGGMACGSGDTTTMRQPCDNTDTRERKRAIRRFGGDYGGRGKRDERGCTQCTCYVDM